MSDWILVVKDGKQSQIYHVHKATLNYGDRKSLFFVKLFEHIYENGNPNQRNVTEMAVDRYAAPHVPLLLDYIYEDRLELNATCAPAMRRLANQFDVRQLYALVSSFIQQDLTEKTVAIYMHQADLVKDKELSEVAMLVAIQHFDLIPDAQLGKIPIHLLQQMISNPDLNAPSAERLSQRIANYLRASDTDIDDESFFFLTHANILPRIHPAEALWYLSFGAKHFPGVLADEGDGGYEASLQRRCAVAACLDWKNSLIAPIKNDIRLKQENGTDGYISGDEGSPTRLFRDGGDDIDENGRAYMSLSDSIRIEILQEALLRASLECNQLNIERENIVRSRSNDHSCKPETVRKEHRSDNHSRGGRKGVREVSEIEKQDSWF